MTGQSCSLDNRLLQLLACPWDHSPLEYRQGKLICAHNHQFQVEEGIPVLNKNPRRELVPGNMRPCQYQSENTPVDPFVNDWIVNTNGNLYWSSRGKLPRYPIPQWPLPPGDGKTVVDVGCSWGRWSIAAARAGYCPVGVDVHMDALAAAGRVSKQLGVSADFVCSDADHLPFCSQSVDVVFSYSVLQHLERSIVRRFYGEVSRVLKPGGVCLVQLPNRFGVVSVLQQLRRGFREARTGTFEMRYWSRREIEEAVRGAGLSTPHIRADGFLSQNPQTSDTDLLPPNGRLIVSISETGRRAAEILPLLTYFADSLWIEAHAGR
jgi:2-polyprenyl-3-methyl-5-hydroxy-6-metoxy-1,4-benzoquinol methylase